MSRRSLMRNAHFTCCAHPLCAWLFLMQHGRGSSKYKSSRLHSFKKGGRWRSKGARWMPLRVTRHAAFPKLFRRPMCQRLVHLRGSSPHTPHDSSSSLPFLPSCFGVHHTTRPLRLSSMPPFFPLYSGGARTGWRRGRLCGRGEVTHEHLLQVRAHRSLGCRLPWHPSRLRRRSTISSAFDAPPSDPGCATLPDTTPTGCRPRDTQTCARIGCGHDGRGSGRCAAENVWSREFPRQTARNRSGTAAR